VFTRRPAHPPLRREALVSRRQACVVGLQLECPSVPSVENDFGDVSGPLAFAVIDCYLSIEIVFGGATIDRAKLID
jgi:hypothetical protein